MPTFFPLNKSAFFNTAASGTAQLGSIIIFILSYTNLKAAFISSSETKIISATCAFIISSVRSLKVVIKPSAIVFTKGAFSTFPD